MVITRDKRVKFNPIPVLSYPKVASTHAKIDEYFDNCFFKTKAKRKRFKDLNLKCMYNV